MLAKLPLKSSQRSDFSPFSILFTSPLIGNIHSTVTGRRCHQNTVVYRSFSTKNGILKGKKVDWDSKNASFSDYFNNLMMSSVAIRIWFTTNPYDTRWKQLRIWVCRMDFLRWNWQLRPTNQQKKPPTPLKAFQIGPAIKDGGKIIVRQCVNLLN